MQEHMRWNWYTGTYEVELVWKSIRSGTGMQDHMRWNWYAGSYEVELVCRIK